MLLPAWDLDQNRITIIHHSFDYIVLVLVLVFQHMYVNDYRPYICVYYMCKFSNFFFYSFKINFLLFVP